MTASTSPLAAFHPGNAMTFASLLAGVGAMALALDGSAAGAGALIATAVIFDTFDGRFARLFVRTASQRDVGVQLDSLSDAVAFGVAPVACLGFLSQLWWPAGFTYTACAIARLAFYNATHGDRTGFVGLPVPVAALIWSTALLAQPVAAATTALMFVSAAAMVLPLPIPRPRGLALALFTCWPLTLVLAHLWLR